jgi:hypothetical protein
MRTNRAADVAIQFHLAQSALKVGRRHSADAGIAFVATYFCLISAHDAKQAATAFGISEVRVWNDGAALTFCADHWIVARQRSLIARISPSPSAGAPFRPGSAGPAE